MYCTWEWVPGILAQQAKRLQAIDIDIHTGDMHAFKNPTLKLNLCDDDTHAYTHQTSWVHTMTPIMAFILLGIIMDC